MTLLSPYLINQIYSLLCSPVQLSLTFQLTFFISFFSSCWNPSLPSSQLMFEFFSSCCRERERAGGRRRQWIDYAMAGFSCALAPARRELSSGLSSDGADWNWRRRGLGLLRTRAAWKWTTAAMAVLVLGTWRQEGKAATAKEGRRHRAGQLLFSFFFLLSFVCCRCLFCWIEVAESGAWWTHNHRRPQDSAGWLWVLWLWCGCRKMIDGCGEFILWWLCLQEQMRWTRSYD